MYVDRLTALTERPMSQPARLRWFWTVAAVSWSAVAAWMAFRGDAPRWPASIILAFVCGAIGLCFFVLLLFGGRPTRRQFLRAACTIVAGHALIVLALDFALIPAPSRLAVAVDAVLIAPGLGIVFASFGVLAVVSAAAVALGIAFSLDLVNKAVRESGENPRKRVRTLSLAVGVLGITLAFLSVTITPHPLAMPTSIRGRGAGLAEISYLFLQSFGITETRPGWFPLTVNVLFVVSLVLIAQFATSPLWSRLIPEKRTT